MKSTNSSLLCVPQTLCVKFNIVIFEKIFIIAKTRLSYAKTKLGLVAQLETKWLTYLAEQRSLEQILKGDLELHWCIDLP